MSIKFPLKNPKKKMQLNTKLFSFKFNFNSFLVNMFY